MGMKPIGYETARKQVRTGDVVAFGGTSLLSKMIKAAGKTVVSHVGVIVAPLRGGEEPRFFESTVRLSGGDPVWGAKITSFRDRWEEYDGEVWLLPLDETIRAQQFDEKRFRDFAAANEGNSFDIPEGLRILIKEFLEELDEILPGEHYFCSEIVADAFLAAGTLPELDPSDVSPKDLCRWRMYSDTYYSREGQLKMRAISKINTLPLGTTS